VRYRESICPVPYGAGFAAGIALLALHNNVWGSQILTKLERH